MTGVFNNLNATVHDGVIEALIFFNQRLPELLKKSNGLD